MPKITRAARTSPATSTGESQPALADRSGKQPPPRDRSGKQLSLADGSGESPSPEDSVGEALEVALDAIHRARSRPEARRAVLGPGGESLSATDRWLLTRLDQTGPLRMSALARWQEVEPSTMTAQVRRLEGRGWVLRQPDPADRRAVTVALQPLGRQVIRHAQDVAREAADRLVAHWPEHERRELSRLLVRLAGELDRLPAATPPLGS